MIVADPAGVPWGGRQPLPHHPLLEGQLRALLARIWGQDLLLFIQSSPCPVSCPLPEPGNTAHPAYTGVFSAFLLPFLP